MQSQLYIPPAAVNGSDPECTHDYLELREGSESQGRTVWRKCGGADGVVTTLASPSASYKSNFTQVSSCLAVFFIKPVTPTTKVAAASYTGFPLYNALSLHGSEPSVAVSTVVARTLPLVSIQTFPLTVNAQTGRNVRDVWK